MNTTVLVLAMSKLLYGRPHRVNTNITKCITSIRYQKKKPLVVIILLIMGQVKQNRLFSGITGYLINKFKSTQNGLGLCT